MSHFNLFFVVYRLVSTLEMFSFTSSNTALKVASICPVQALWEYSARLRLLLRSGARPRHARCNTLRCPLYEEQVTVRCHTLADSNLTYHAIFRWIVNIYFIIDLFREQWRTTSGGCTSYIVRGLQNSQIQSNIHTYL